MLKWSSLRALLAIVETGSINAAAKRLGMAQPALSRSLRDMEREIGAPLLDRQKTGAVLTAAGQRFAKRAALAMNELERAQDEIRQTHGHEQGSIAVCLSSMLQLELFREAIRHFHIAYPHVVVRVIEGTYAIVNSRLRRGEVEFYIGPAPDPLLAQGLSVETLFQTQRVVLARKGHPLAQARSLADLSEAAWVIAQGNEQSEAAFSRLFLERGLPAPRVLVKTDTALAWMSALMNSDLLIMQPMQQADSPFVRDFFIQLDLDEVFDGVSIALVKRSEIPLTPAAEFFCDLLRRPVERVGAGFAREALQPPSHPSSAPARHI